MKKLIYLLTFCAISTSCKDKYESARDITHSEYLNIEPKAKEMKVTFFVDELNKGVYIPKEKVNMTEFNSSLKNLFLYPNISYTTVNEDFVVDGKILKHLLISYLNNPVDINYIFNSQGNIINIAVTDPYIGKLQINILYDNQGNIEKYTEKDSKGLNTLTETFNYDDNNLLLQKKKTVYNNGKEVGGSEVLYNYTITSDTKIKCTMTSGKTKTIFQIIRQDENITSFGNEDYTVKFTDIYLLSEEKFVGTKIDKSRSNTFENNRLKSAIIKDNNYVEYTLDYRNNQIANIVGKQDGAQESFQIKTESDSKGNWTKMIIANEAAFNKYKKIEADIATLESNKFYMDEFMYNTKRSFIEVDRIALRHLLNQRRCERNIIY